ncbi:MAG: NAD-dependent epimerase/dehydratase family protein, partial [Oscillospiraceae bacterium]
MEENVYIVTGAMGHLGNNLINKLLENGEKVIGLALNGDETVEYQNPNFRLVRGNVCDIASLEPLFDGTDGKKIFVIHTAGIVSIASKYQQKVFDVNVGGTNNILKICLAHNVAKLVHVSSVHAIPEVANNGVISEVSSFNPDDVFGLYAKTKSKASQLVLDAVRQGLNASIVHPSGIFGPCDFSHGHLTQMIIDYLNGNLFAFVKGGYDFVDVRDVADGIISCIEKGAAGECYILSNQYYTVGEILEIVHNITGKKMLKTCLPTWLAKCTAPLAESYYRMKKTPPLYTAYSLYTLSCNANFSHEKAGEMLSYHPRLMRNTLKDTVKWLSDSGRLKNKLDL